MLYCSRIPAGGTKRAALLSTDSAILCAPVLTQDGMPFFTDQHFYVFPLFITI